MRKKTVIRGDAPAPPARCDRRYVVVYSDDDSKWTIEVGKVGRTPYDYHESISRSQAVRFAPNPKAAIDGLAAPPGRVFRVIDIDSGDLQEFVVEHVRTVA